MGSKTKRSACSRTAVGAHGRLARFHDASPGAGRPPGPTGPRLFSQHSTRGYDRGSARLSRSSASPLTPCHPVGQPGCLSIPILALSSTYLIRLPRSSDLACSGWLSNAAAITTASVASTPTNCQSAFPFWLSLPLACSCCIHCINVPGVRYIRTRTIQLCARRPSSVARW